MRVLGIDYGDRRIGVSVSDAFGWTASSLGFIDVKKYKNEVFDIIGQYIKEYQTETIVVGYPLNMNGTKGPRAEITVLFITQLTEKFPDIKTVKWDERLTTVAAGRIMRDLNISSRRKGVKDEIAAVLILQSYLDSIIIKEEKNNGE